MTSTAQNSKQVLSQKGSAATPSFSFLGNNNTGFYLSNTNEISVSTNGTLRLTIGATGNVTLTTSATVPLVIGGTTASSSLTLQSTSGVGTSDSILFKVGNNGATTAMTINTSGQVGIGQAAPTGLLELRKGSPTTLVMSHTNGTGYEATISANYNAAESFSITTGSNKFLSYVPNALSGAGMIVLGAINNGVRINGNVGRLYFASSAGTDLVSIRSGTGSVNDLEFYTNSTERMRIDSSGNVGIGTAAPTNILSLGGNTARTFWMERHTTANTAGNNLTIQSGGATSGATDKNGGTLALQSGTATGSGSSIITFSTATAGAAGTTDRTVTEKMRIDGTAVYEVISGTLYNIASQYDIGTNPNQIPLNQYLGTMAYQDAAYLNVGSIYATGLVGIGTASPSALLTLAAGTATANTGPLKFTSGTNLSTPEAGAVEYDGTIMTATSNTNFKRGTIPLTNYASGTGTALGTNTEATLAAFLPAANDTITLSAGTYFLDVTYIVTRGASTTSATTRLNILGSGGAAGNFTGVAVSSVAAGGATNNFFFDAVNINTSNVVSAANTASGGIYYVTFRGMLKITTGGTIVPQYNLSANINGAGTVSKVYHFNLTQLDTQSAAAFGPAGTGWA